MAIAVKWVKSGGAVSTAGVNVLRSASEPVAAGDVLVAIYKQRGGLADSDTPPPGWTRNPQALIGTASQYRNLYHKVITDATAAAAEPTTYNFNFGPAGSGSASQVAMVVCFTGVDTSLVQNGSPLPAGYAATPNTSQNNSNNLAHPDLAFPQAGNWFVIRGVLYTGNANAINPVWDPALTVIAVRNFGSTSEVIGLAYEQLAAAANAGTRFTPTHNATGAVAGVSPWMATTWTLPEQPSGVPPTATTPKPTMTGTARVGNAATINPGGWSGSPTGYRYQVQRNGVDVAGASGTFTTTASYNYQPGDDSEPMTVRVWATNAAGESAAPAVSDPVVPIAAGPPTLTDPPTLTVVGGGAAVVGATLRVVPGGWSGPVTGHEYAFDAFSGGAWVEIQPLGPSTDYVIAPGDSGQIRGIDVALNSAGASQEAATAPIQVVAPIQVTDIQWTLGGGPDNADPGSSLGGTPSRTPVASNTLGNLLPNPSGAEMFFGTDDYALMFLTDLHELTGIDNVSIWSDEAAVPPGVTYEFALATEGVGAPVAAIANRKTPPPGVTWQVPSAAAPWVIGGVVGPGQGVPVWVHRRIAPLTPGLPHMPVTLLSSFDFAS